MSGEVSARRSDGSFRLLLAVSVLAPLLLFLATAYYDYNKEKRDAVRQITATADALAEHAQKVIETSQLVLSLVSDRTRGQDWEHAAEDAGLHGFLDRLTKALPQIESIFVVSPQGRIAASSRSFPTPPVDVTDREYVRAVASGNRGLLVSAPFRGRTSGTTAFTVSRPADASEPTGAIVAVTLSPGYFIRFYEAVAESQDDARASLLRQDGTFLVRFPPDQEPPRLTARSLLTPAEIQAAMAGTVERQRADGSGMRILAFHRLTAAPLLVTYSISVRAALADWYRHVAVLAAFALGLACMLAYSTHAAMRRTAEEQRSLRLLLAETTRREQAEDAVRQLQKMDALGRLTGGVAHDFNNLLTAVIGSLELASKRVAEPRVARLLAGAMEAAQRGARLTHQMLAFSRQRDVALEPVAVDAALQAMDEMLSRALGPQYPVQYALQGDLWPALADATQLEVAVLNLAINSRDAMPRGGAIRVTAANVGAGAARPAGVPVGDMVEIGVHDTGTGMPEAVARRATEPFFTTKEVGRGTGLGLSMVHGLARRAGGALVIDSVPDQGTTVRLFLPRAPEAAAVAVPAPTTVASGPSRLVLVVDDDPEVRALSAEMLRELGHRVVEAADGPTALAVLETTPQVELMVVDYVMPLMNGGEVARRATEIKPGLPLVFVSGYTEPGALQEWTARGYKLVAKPFTLPQLAEGVAAATSTQEPALPR